MPSTLIVGDVGAGKTYTALATIYHNKDKGYSNVYPNFAMRMPGREIHQWLDPKTLKTANCGYLVIDEADMWFNSRNYATLDDVFRNLLKEHRKHHLRIIYTTQHLSMIDKIMRIFLDDVKVVKKYSLPFIGWIWKKCVRKDIRCKHCGLVRVDDGRGDRDTWWKQMFGFGTIYIWQTFPTTILREEENTDAVQERIEPIKSGVFLYDHAIACLYDTSGKVSEEVAKFTEQKKTTGALRQWFKKNS